MHIIGMSYQSRVQLQKRSYLRKGNVKNGIHIKSWGKPQEWALQGSPERSNLPCQGQNYLYLNQKEGTSGGVLAQNRASKRQWRGDDPFSYHSLSYSHYILLKNKEYLNLTQFFSAFIFIIFLEDKPETNTKDSITIKNLGSGVR